MFTFIPLFFSLICSVIAFPLASRDVVDPPVTSPTTGTVWHVGQTQTVTWNATGLPVNQSNPVGMLVLGYLFNNSENLMLNSPLATHLNYSVGQAQITVPNVPTRSDYIVVLFGDSGNASPEFTIINDTSPSTSTPSPSPTSSPGSAPPEPPAQASTPPANDSPSSPSGGSSPTTLTAPLTTATTPASQTASRSNASTTVVVQATSPPSTHSSAAGQRHVPNLRTSLGVALVAIYFAFS